ncbi:MAG: G5 domain-containing protein [Clostridia bacterium]|nr:G5 domain-containing protein [Clostridia bacterium]
MHNKIMSAKGRKRSASRKFSIYDIYDKLNHARCKTSAVLAGMFIFANTVTFAAPYTVDVKLYDNGNMTEAVSVPSTVGEFLDSKDITLGQYDIVHPAVDTYFTDSQVIVIERVKKVILNDAGVTSEYFTTKNTVGEFLEDNGIELGFYDSIDVSIDTVLSETNSIAINRVVKTTVSVDTPIPFRTVTKESSGWEEGSSLVVKEGKTGVLTKKYEVYLTNGVETNRVEISSEVTSEPVDKQVLIGTGKKAADVVATAGAPTNYSAVLTCTATAYDLSFQSCGKRPGDRGYGITATGTQAAYGTVAVDPRVIPLGSKLYIETTDGSFVYGYATAADTGGAIKGNKVDLFFPSYNDCMSFGRRSVRVYILN